MKAFHYIVLISFFTLSCGSGTVTSVKEGEVKDGFTPSVADCSSPPIESVYICKNESVSSRDMIAVDIIINSSTPVLGAAFDIVYDPTLVKVARTEDGSVDFLSTGQNPWRHLFVVESNDHHGSLIIGASIDGAPIGGGALARAGEPLTGNIPLLTLKFMRPSEMTTLHFSHNRLLDLSGQPIGIYQDSWYAGDLSP